MVAGTISTKSIKMAPGIYRVRLEVFGADSASLPHPFVFGAYSSKPVSLQAAQDVELTEFVLPEFLQQFGMVRVIVKCMMLNYMCSLSR